jgi:hypothetical protein
MLTKEKVKKRGEATPVTGHGGQLPFTARKIPGTHFC